MTSTASRAVPFARPRALSPRIGWIDVAPPRYLPVLTPEATVFDLPAPRRGRPRRTDAAHAWPHGLTPREVTVLLALTEGLTDQQIANRLGLRRRTVSNCLNAAYRKLGVHNRAGATAFTLRELYDLVPRDATEGSKRE